MRAKRQRRHPRRQTGLESLEQRVVMDVSAGWADPVADAGPGDDFGSQAAVFARPTTSFAASADFSFTQTAAPPAAPPGLSMRVAATVIRGSAAAFELSLPAPAGAAGASVSYSTADIGAKAGIDYRAMSGRITFAPGERFKQVAVPTIAGLPAGSKPLTFALVLSQPVNVKLNSAQAVTTVVTRAQQFNPVFGFGLVNAAAAVAQASGRIEPFVQTPDLGGNAWGQDLVKAPEAWARGYTGRGVTVAVIDSGVDYTHPDLASNIWVNAREVPGDGIDNDRNGYVDDIRGWNFNGNGGRGSNDPQDDDGHGTHVAGTIAALRNGIGVTGVAPDAKIMPLKVRNPSFPTFDDYHNSVAQAIRYAVDNGARVINMSIRTLPEIGPTLSFGSRPVAAIQDALAYAASRNVIAVAAAGNSQESASFSGYPEIAASPLYPAAYSTMYGLSVGAVDYQGMIASFSNYASNSPTQHQVMAPGVEVYSTFPRGTYEYLSGTSMASPHVAGVVALMVGANPRITSNQVRSIVPNTSQRLLGTIITARPTKVASLPLLAAAVGLDQPIWVVPGSAARGSDRVRVLATAPAGAPAPAAAALPASAFAALGADEPGAARRSRGATAVDPEAPAVAGGVAVHVGVGLPG